MTDSRPMIFVNLPVRDLAAARRFYEGLGFTINEMFSDETGACVVISDTIYVMILTAPKFEQFSPRPIAWPSEATAHLLALSMPSRAAVDGMISAAIAHGGTDNDLTQEHGDMMYCRSFSDPDGHVWEAFWMNPAATGADIPA